MKLDAALNFPVEKRTVKGGSTGGMPLHFEGCGQLLDYREVDHELPLSLRLAKDLLQGKSW